ncbi:MAG: XdhC family protein [Alphaproteobacteria bacterium]
MLTETLTKVLAAQGAKEPAALITRIEDGSQCLIVGEAVTGALSVGPETITTARTAIQHDKPGIIETSDGRFFVQVYNPPKRMIVVGAVHISQVLAPMAALAGYDVTIVDPRGAFATQERFPGVTLNDAWPGEALEALAPDSRTAIVTLTHDPKLDDPALHVALRSDAFYIGSLGSRKTHGARLERLDEAGFDDAAKARIHGPIGLNIGAKSPAEIAVAILAQVTEVLHRGPAKVGS